MWVGRNRLAPIEPESVERILGYPLNHTQTAGLSVGERLHSLKHSFQTHTLGYRLYVLKSVLRLLNEPTAAAHKKAMLGGKKKPIEL